MGGRLSPPSWPGPAFLDARRLLRRAGRDASRPQGGGLSYRKEKSND
jgi:hypothetical protein